MFADRSNRASDIALPSNPLSAAAILASSQLPSLGSPTTTFTQNAVNPSSSSSALATSATTAGSQLASSQLTTAPTPSSQASTKSQAAVGADFNGDGQTDLLWRNYTTGEKGENTVWLMHGTTRLSIASLMSVADLNWRIEGANDFNSDGKTDIVWRNYTTGQNAIWFMDGTAFKSSAYLTPVADTNWQIQGAADFTGDGKPDLLWRNYATGQNGIWVMNGTTQTTTLSVPSAVGVNLRIQAVADFDQDGKLDILWRNYLSGENFVWSLSGVPAGSVTIASTTFLPTTEYTKDLNWQIQGAGDSNGDGKADLFWRNIATSQTNVQVMDGLKNTGQWVDLPAATNVSWRIGLQDTLITPSPIKISDLTFSGKEGDRGTFKLQLTQAPTTNVTLTFATGSFVVVDADSTVANGTQNTLTFTPQDWQTVRTVSFIAENDNSSSDRLLGNTVSYTLSGGLTGSAVYELGKVTNTYAPDLTRFNIDLDFRNDPLGFWTPAHRAIAQKAANDWATQIANEWSDFQLNSTIGKLDVNATRPYSFTSKRYVDDLLIFLNPYQSSTSLEAGTGGPDYQFGGWISSPELMPRVGQIALNAASFSATNDPTGILLYQVVTHEIGHVLGLVGLNWVGYNLEDRSTPQTAVFKGAYATAANGGNPVPLQSQDGANPVTGTYDYSHPADSVQSILSYGWLYRLSAPSTLDYAMLADSGYRVYGFNA